MNRDDLLNELETLRSRVAALEDSRLTLIQTQQALSESEESLRLLYENAPLGYQSLDEHGRFLEVNRAWLETLGYSRDEVIGKWFGDFLPAEYQERFKVNFPKFKAAGEIHWVEFDMIRKDGTIVSVAFDGKIGRDLMGNFRRTHCILHDITEIKQTEESLIRNNERLSSILESISDGFFTLDQHLRITYFNKAAEKLVRRKAQDVIGRLLTEAFPQVAGSVFEAKYTEALRDHISLHFETWFGVPPSEDCYEVRVYPYGAGISVYFQVTTERKRAEEALRESESMLASILNAVPQSIFWKDRNSVYVGCNKVFAKTVGLENPDQVVGKTDLELPWVREEAHAYRADDQEVMTHNEAKRHIIEPCQQADGSTLWVDTTKVPLVDRNNNVYGVLGVFEDITERKWAEEALRESESMLRESQRVAAIGHYQLNALSGYWTSSEALDHIFGIGPDYPRTVEGWLEIVHQECREEMLAYFRDHVLRDKNLFDREYRIARISDGEPRWVHGRGNLAFDALGQPVRMFGTIQDITDRKQAEKDLREREEKYRDLFDNSTDFIFTCDLTGNWTSVNKAAAVFLGYSADELQGRNFREIVDSESLSQATENFQRLISGEISHTNPHEILVRARDCRPVWVEVSSRIIMHGESPIGVHGIARDVTARKAAETEKARLATAIEQAAETVVITDTSGTIVYVNPAFEQITGYSRDEAVGQNARFLKSGQHDQEFYDKLWKTISSGKTWSGHFINRKKDGALIEEEATIAPVKDKAGKIENYVAVKRDVTNEVLLQKQLLEAQKMEAVGTLAGGIAHDFNNLLQVINGFAEMALFDIKEGQSGYSELLEIRRAARSAAELTQGLLTFSRRVESKLRPVDLNRELKNVARMLTRTLPKMIKINMDLSEPLRTVSADPAQLLQVVMNLAVNARDAMPNGGRLSIQTRNVDLDEEYCKSHLDSAPGEYVLLSVSDDGVGMEAKTRQHIFDPFFTTKETGKGTGLGLPIAFGIVKSHGGNILCYSEPGRGTTFKIYLPAFGTARVAMETGAIKSYVGGKETVLVVDDEDSVRKLASRLLKKYGYSVLTAENGRQGLEVFSQESGRIDLVILDLIMPEMSGLDCLREVLKIAPGTKVIIASGYASNGSVDEAIGGGAKTSVRKPYEAPQLLELVRRVLDEE